MYLLRNYNNYIIRDGNKFAWKDLGIHRWDHDFDKLVKFQSRREAEKFAREHSELEKNFGIWIVYEEKGNWNGTVE